MMTASAPGSENEKENGPLILDGSSLTIEHVRQVAAEGRQVIIADSAMDRLAAARKVIHALAEQGTPVYGLNRGVGGNKDRTICNDFFAEYNRNLLLSHSVGIGPEAMEAEVRAVMLARLNGLLLGHTGVQPQVAIRYGEFLNSGIHPLLPLQGSVGAADITNLSPIGLAMIGEGDVRRDGLRMPAAEALAGAGLAPLVLGPKDGLAIVSSNALSAGLGALGLAECRDVLELADLAAALSFEALPGNTGTLDPAVHQVRPYDGQLSSLRVILSALEGSAIWEPHAADATPALQDPLSFRSVCQINGAARDALAYSERQLSVQLNSSDDNPCVLPEEERIVSCANFNPLVWVLGFEMLGSALHHVSRGSVFRTLKLGDPRFTGLSRFLTPDADRFIGFGTVQKTASSLDAEIRHLSNPASADFVSLAGDMEDHATNAPFIVAKTREMIRKLHYVLAIELMHGAQAVDLRGDLRLGKGTAEAYQAIRKVVPFLAADRPLSRDIGTLAEICRNGSLLREVRTDMHGRN